MNSTNMHKSRRSNYLYYQSTLYTLCSYLILAVSNQYKYYYSKEINTKIQTKIPKFGKLCFLTNIITMRVKIFKKSTTLLAFKKTGLIVYNSDNILQKIYLPNSQTFSSQLITPPLFFNPFSGIYNKKP